MPSTRITSSRRLSTTRGSTSTKKRWPVYHVPSGNRSERVPGRAATFPDPSQFGSLHQFSLAASYGNVRLHDVPQRFGSRDEFSECGTHAAQRRGAEAVAAEIQVA